MLKLPAGFKSPGNSVSPMTVAIEYGAPPSMGEQSGRPSDFSSSSVGGGRSGGGRSGGGGGSRGGGGGSRGGSMAGGAPAGGASGGYTGAQNVPPPVLIWIKNIKLAEKR